MSRKLSINTSEDNKNSIDLKETCLIKTGKSPPLFIFYYFLFIYFIREIRKCRLPKSWKRVCSSLKLKESNSGAPELVILLQLMSIMFNSTVYNYNSRSQNIFNNCWEASEI